MIAAGESQAVSTASFARRASIVGFNSSATPGIASTLSNSWLSDGISGLTIPARTFRCSGITDAASAQAALPKLREVTTQIDKVDGLLAQLSPEQRKVLAGIVNPLMPSLNQLFDKVLAIPGVAE